MTTRATFSIAVPCYNYGIYLEACVQSVLGQAGVEVDILIIDDCSSDETPVIGRRLAEDARVTFLRHETNKGHIATFNAGVDWASNEFFVLLSADDLLAPGALGRAAQAFGSHPEVGMVYGGVVRFSDAITMSDCGGYSDVTVYRGWDWIERRCRASDNSTHSPEIVLRTALQKRIGHYDKRCRHTSDLNMWLRAASSADVAYLNGAVQAFYRIHGKNMSLVEHGAKLGQFEQNWCAFESFFATVPASSQSARLEAVVRQRIAQDTLYQASRDVERGKVKTVGDLEPYLKLARRLEPRIENSWWFRGLILRLRIGRASRFVPFFYYRRGRAYLRRRKKWHDMDRHGL